MRTSPLLVVALAIAGGCDVPGTDQITLDGVTEIETIEVGPMQRVLRHADGLVTVPTPADRVIALNSADELCHLGVRPIAAAQAWDERRFRMHVRGCLAGTRSILNDPSELAIFESVAAARPDLLTLGHWESAGLRRVWQVVAPAVAVGGWKCVGDCGTSNRTRLRGVARVFGLEERADALIVAHEAEVERVRRCIAATAPDDRLAVIYFWGEQMFCKNLSVGYERATGILIHERLGTRPAHWERHDRCSLEDLIRRPAERIIAVVGGRPGSQAFYAKVAATAVWRGQPAVQRGQVLVADPGPWLATSMLADEWKVADVAHVYGCGPRGRPRP